MFAVSCLLFRAEIRAIYLYGLIDQYRNPAKSTIKY
jgi:hypothetical protein